MAKAKVKAKKAKRPPKNLDNISVVKGSKKGPSSKGEVAGHAALCLYGCWACGAGNWAPCGCSYFICWNCGALNWC